MFEILINKIAKNLDRRRVPYMMIGGQAILLYGKPRLTEDIDITLGVDIDTVPQIESLCKELNLKMLSKNSAEFAAKTMVLPARDPKTGIRIDFIFSFSRYEREAIRRSKKVKVRNYPVAFASVEDLIIHKIFSGRAIDIQDVKNVMIKVGLEKINISYVRSWLKKFQEAASLDLIKIFNGILKEAR